MDNTLRRKAAINGGDTNGTDAFDPAIEWDGFAADTFDGLGSRAVGGTCNANTQHGTNRDGDPGQATVQPAFRRIRRSR